jgi:hypothetical protein
VNGELLRCRYSDYNTGPSGKGGKDWGYTFDVTKAMRMNVAATRSTARCAFRSGSGK